MFNYSLLTNEEHDLSPLIFVNCIDVGEIAWQAAPHFRNFVGIPIVQAFVADAPKITPFKYKYFPPNDGDGVI